MQSMPDHSVLDSVHLAWCIDLLKRIKVVLDDASVESDVKVQQIQWLVKQALKVERED